MKSFILVIAVGINTTSPTYETQRFDSKKACRVAAERVVKSCHTIDIDGGSHNVCVAVQGVEAYCLPAK